MMPTKGQVHQNQKDAAKQLSPQPEIRDAEMLDQQIIQQARLAPRSLSPRAVLQLQHAVGNQMVSRLLDAGGSGQGMAGVIPNQVDNNITTDGDIGVVQRTLQGAYQALVTAGGAVSKKATAKKIFSLGLAASTYDKILSAVSEYEREEQANRKPGTWFLQKLTTIENLCNQWLADAEHQQDIQAGDQKAVDRAQALRNLLGQVNTERQNLTQPAQLTALDLSVDDAIKDGHGMDITLRIQCPRFPTPSQTPHTVYGVRLEYWERIEVEYDFNSDAAAAGANIAAHVGQKTKPWNDIYALAPEVQSWALTPATTNISLKDAAQQAARGELNGLVTVGFRDQPAFSARDQRYGKRILRFRIVARDLSGHRQEILATQTILLSGGLVSTKQFDVGTVDPASTATTGLGVANTGVAPVFVPDIPAAANLALPAFVQSLRAGHGAAFNNQELDQVTQIAATLGRWDIDYLYPKLGRIGPGGTELAGINLTPYPHPGQQYKQCVVGGNALLVALMQGAEILRMYYTDGTFRQVQHGELNNQPVQVRSFVEVPIETVEAVP